MRYGLAWFAPLASSFSGSFLRPSGIRSMTHYADQVLGQADGASFEAAHRTAGLYTTNLQAAIQRTVGDIEMDAGTFAAFGLAAAALQRLFVSLNAVGNTSPRPVGTDMAQFRSVSSRRSIA